MSVYRSAIATLLGVALLAGGCAPRAPEGRYPTEERGRYSIFRRVGDGVGEFIDENDVIKRAVIDGVIVPAITGK